jgi:hypothetical protein
MRDPRRDRGRQTMILVIAGVIADIWETLVAKRRNAKRIKGMKP